MFSSKLRFGDFTFEGGFGAEVIYLETAFKKFSGREFNIAVSSATAAADMIFSYPGVSLTVNVPTLTFASPAMMILRNGGTVCINDVDDNLTQLPDASLCSCMPVMYGGSYNPPAHTVTVIDAAHNPCTCHVEAEFVFTSFYPTKPLRCLNGGMISTNNEEAAEYFLKYRNFGRQMGGSSYKIEQAGNKYYLDKFNAAIVLEQLDSYQDNVGKRRENFKVLADLRGGRLIQHDENSSYYFATFIWDDPERVESAKSKLLEKLNLNCPLHYPLLHQQPFFQKHPNTLNRSGCHNAERLVGRLLNLPLAEYFPEELYKDIVKCLHSL